MSAKKKPAKKSAAKKATAKAKAPAKAKVKAVAKPAKVTPVKATVKKQTAKPAAKKPISRTAPPKVGKSAPAPKAKAAKQTRPAAKPVSKPTAKATAAPKAKAKVKPTAKPAAKKPVPAPKVAKPATKAAKKTVKPATKPAAKPAPAKKKATAKAVTISSPVQSKKTSTDPKSKPAPAAKPKADAAKKPAPAPKAPAKPAAKAPAKQPAKPAPKAPAKPAAKDSAPVAKKPVPAAPAPKKAPAAAKPAATPAEIHSPEVDAKTKELVLGARKRANGATQARPLRSKGAPIVFTMDDVAQVLARKESEPAAKSAPSEPVAPRVVKKQEVEVELPPQEQRVHSAVSLSDILGFNPAQKKSPTVSASPLNPGGQEVPRKWSRYHKALLDLREQVSRVLEQHTADTLKRSNREDSGDLSGYGQHMADAGTDTFDRDFALSMVSSEQETLFEIEEAIRRIFNGSYGLCEITGEQISADRLEAVPHTRYSLEGQKELEKTKRQKIQRGGVFTDNEDNLSFDEDEN